MPKNRETALRRRIAPSVPLTLETVDSQGTKYTLSLRLAFDVNAGVAIQEKSGINIGHLDIWSRAGEPIFVRTVLWGAVLAHQPDYYTTDDAGRLTNAGLEAIGSYIDDSNTPAVIEALWKAYLAFLSPARREYMENLREHQERQAEELRKRLEAGEDVPLAEAPAATGTNETTSPTNATGAQSGPLPDTTSDSAIAKSAS
jgi:hypothetical protein